MPSRFCPSGSQILGKKITVLKTVRQITSLLALVNVSLYVCDIACLAGITSKHRNVPLDPKKSRLLVQDPIIPCSWGMGVFARHEEPKGTLNHASIHMIRET